MEEILASIRRIIADDDAKPAETAPPAPAAKASPKPAAPPPEPVKAAAPAKPPAAPAKPAPAPAPKAQEKEPEMAASNSQDDIDAMLAGLDAETVEEEIRAPEEFAMPEPVMPEPVMPEPVEDILDLTEAMAVAAPAPEFKKITAEHDLEFTEDKSVEDKAGMAKAAPAESTFAAAPVHASIPMQTESSLASAATVASVNSAFNALANTVLSNNARTLEDLVREMLRPMLRAWLDDNLPGLVERLVKAEIERVSRGR